MSRRSLATPSRWLSIVRILVLIGLSSSQSLSFTCRRIKACATWKPATSQALHLRVGLPNRSQSVVTISASVRQWLATTRLAASLICLLCFWGIAGLLLVVDPTPGWAYWPGLSCLSTGPGFQRSAIGSVQLAPWTTTDVSTPASVQMLRTHFRYLIFPNGRFVPRWYPLTWPFCPAC